MNIEWTIFSDLTFRYIRIISSNINILYFFHLDCLSVSCKHPCSYDYCISLSYAILPTMCGLTKKGTHSSFSLCRGENQLDQGEDAVHVVLAVGPGLVSVPCPGLGSIRPGALRVVLLHCLGRDETRGLLLHHLHVHRQPRHSFPHHRFLLLWHRHQALLHLQEVQRDQPGPKHCQAALEAVDSKWLFMMSKIYYYRPGDFKCLLSSRL